jgi:hypothetical protein
MIDASADASYAAFERDQARREAARARASRPSRRAAPTGALTTLPPDPSAIDAPGSLQVVSVPEATIAVPVPDPVPREPSDPLAHLRLARLGFVAVVVGILVLLWLRKR